MKAKGQRSGRLIMVVGALLAIVALLGVLTVGKPPAAPAVLAPLTAKVVVAQTDIAALTTLTAAMLTTIDYPKSAFPTGGSGNPAELVGKVSLIQIPAQSPVLSNMLGSSPAQAQASASQSLAVPAGMVAITVPVKPGPQTVDGYLHPGDHVNMVTTFTPAAGTPVVQTSMQNLVIYKMGGPASPSGAAPAPSGTSAAAIAASGAALATTLTLIVTPQDALSLEYLVTQSPIFVFVLRSPQDNSVTFNTTVVTQPSVATLYKF